MPSMRFRWILPALCLVAGACSRSPEPAHTSASAGQAVVAEPVVQRKPQQDIDWSPITLEAGDAWVDCSADYDAGNGRPVLSLHYEDLLRTLEDCRATGLLRLRYEGKVTPSFAALAERVGRVAGDLGIGKRILDLDSAGGQVEAAIRAGDAIGENDWIIWVREDSVCHSACVLLLAAGDMRVIAGPVGIHRMIRVRSAATSRKELGEELRKVSDDLRNYLERNGASAEVYDLMTTVPNRALRILTADELERFGLSGPNAVEDDLDRIRLARRCGIGFLQRRDAFRRAYDAQCVHVAEGEMQDVDQLNQCGLGLRTRFGFPDATCPDESPMAELDGLVRIPQAPPIELPALQAEPHSALHAPAPARGTQAAKPAPASAEPAIAPPEAEPKPVIVPAPAEDDPGVASPGEPDAPTLPTV